MPRDTNRVNYLNAAAYQRRHSEPGVAMEYASQARNLARKLNFPSGEAEALDNLAETSATLSQYADQLDFLLESLRIKEEMGDKNAMTRSLNGLGNFHFLQKNFDQALEFYRRTIRLYDELETGNKAGVLNNVGSVMINKGQLDSAMTYFQAALEINREKGREDWESINLGNIGLVYSRKNQDNKAVEYYRQSLKIHEKSGNKRGIASVLENLAFSLSKLGNYSEAENQYRRSLEAARQVKGLALQESAFAGLSDLFESLNRPDSVVKYLRLQMAMKDSIFNQETAQRIADAEKRYQAERMMAEKELALREQQIQREAEINRGKLIRNFLIVGAGLLAGLLFLLFFRYREKRKANELLEEKVLERTRELKETQDELNTFIYRSSHDLRSPLTSIQGILEMSGDKVSGEMASILSLIGNRVSHLTTQLERLIETVELQQDNIQEQQLDWNELVAGVKDKLKGMEGFDEVQIDAWSDGNRDFLGDAKIIGMMVRNVMDNSIQFRSEDQKTEISAGLKTSGERVEIIIEDNGPGMPEEVLARCTNMFYRGSERSKGAGLGLYMVRKAVRQLNGKLEITSEPGKGTRVKIILPSLRN